jgi:hypothetical protein
VRFGFEDARFATVFFAGVRFTGLRATTFFRLTVFAALCLARAGRASSRIAS